MGDMNAPLRFRIREGCRGGQEQFKWNQIKDQEFKDREQYLGQSMKVGMMGKFGRYYVHDWYARKRDTVEKIEDERASVQAYEEELMQEALGLKPKRLLLSKKQLSDEELKEFLKRDDEKSADKKGMTPMGPQKKIVKNEFGEEVATSNEDYVAEAAREAPIKGVGFASHRTTKLEEIKAKAFGTESQLAGSTSQSSSSKAEVKQEKEEVKSELEDDRAIGSAGVAELRAAAGRGVVLDEVKAEKECDEPPAKRCRGEADRKEQKLKKEKKEDKKRRKEEKKIKKLEKKLKRVAKKERKAAKLQARKASRASGSSSSSSSSS